MKLLLQRFKPSNAIEILNRIMFNFYPGLPQVYNAETLVWGLFRLTLILDANSGAKK